MQKQKIIKEHFMLKKIFEDSGFTFQGFFGMSNEEKAVYEKEHPFPYQSIEEYTDDVVEWLCQSPWHYSEELARQQVKVREDWIIECYNLKAPIDLAGAEAGYCCG